MANILPEELNSEELARRYAEALDELQKRKASEEAQGRRSSITDKNIEALAMDVAKARVGKKEEEDKPGIFESLAKGLGSIPGALSKAAGSLETAKADITDPTESNKKMKEVFGKYGEALAGPGSYQKMHEYQAGAKLPPMPEPKKADANISRLAAEKPLIEDQAPAVPSPAKLKEAAPAEARKEVKQASKTIENQIANIGGPKEEKDSFKERLKALQDMEDSYWNEYKTSKNRLEFMQAMEMVGLAFAQLGAGLQGQRTGVDLSGLKFNKTDWEKKIDTTLEELKQGLQRTSSAKKALADEEQFIKGQQFRREESEAERKWRTEESAKDRAARLQEAEAKAAADTKKEQMATAKTEAALLKEKLNQADDIFKNKKAGDPIFKDEESLQTWATSIFGAEAATDIVKKAQEGEMWGLDTAKAKAAMVPYLAKMRARQEELALGKIPGQQGPGSVQSAGGGAKDPAITDYANKYLQGDYAKAKEILVKRGYQPKEQ